jgi:hypothetical protein
MRRLIARSICWSLALTLLAAGRIVADTTPSYQSGTLLSIDQQVVRTPLSYTFDVVASFYETVTYRMEVQVGKQTFTVEYAPPVQPDGPLPREWVVKASVQVCVEKRDLIFKLKSGRELATRIIGVRKDRV